MPSIPVPKTALHKESQRREKVPFATEKKVPAINGFFAPGSSELAIRERC
jgi:hypothetical protein